MLSALLLADCGDGVSDPPVAAVNLRLDRTSVPIGGPLETSTPVTIDSTVTAAELGSDDIVRLELLVDQTFIPSELSVGEDARELGVQVLSVYVEPL